MDEHEANRQIIDGLLGCVEDCLALAMAYRAVLAADEVRDWEARARIAEVFMRAATHEAFSRIRETYPQSSSETQPPEDWLQIVRALIESAENPDRGE
jgi:hypothetical protein